MREENLPDGRAPALPAEAEAAVGEVQSGGDLAGRPPADVAVQPDGGHDEMTGWRLIWSDMIWSDMIWSRTLFLKWKNIKYQSQDMTVLVLDCENRMCNERSEIIGKAALNTMRHKISWVSPLDHLLSVASLGTFSSVAFLSRDLKNESSKWKARFKNESSASFSIPFSCSNISICSSR